MRVNKTVFFGDRQLNEELKLTMNLNIAESQGGSGDNSEEDHHCKRLLCCFCKDLNGCVSVGAVCFLCRFSSPFIRKQSFSVSHDVPVCKWAFSGVTTQPQASHFCFLCVIPDFYLFIFYIFIVAILLQNTRVKYVPYCVKIYFSVWDRKDLEQLIQRLFVKWSFYCFVLKGAICKNHQHTIMNIILRNKSFNIMVSMCLITDSMLASDTSKTTIKNNASLGPSLYN